jgi:hypothetical protein
MTRFLSESLEAPEPNFRLQLRQLERTNGNPNADIRLSTDVAQATRLKLRELGLDPADTTAKELYESLKNMLADDDVRITRLLRTRAAIHISAEADAIAGLTHLLREAKQSEKVFALKTTKFKTLIKKTPPKRVMKQLGYRSLDSLLRHEAPALILTAASYLESASWWQSYYAQYKKITARDFEARTMAILHPDARRWQALAGLSVARSKHNVCFFKELGALILLPLPNDAPKGSAITSVMLALQAINDITSASSYLQVCQVKSDFGSLVRSVASHEPMLEAQLFEHELPWHLVQRSLGKLASSVQSELFGPHIQASELSWQSLGQSLHALEPSLAFWHGSEHLGRLHEGRAVSMHVLDVALNLCNDVPFERRIVRYFQQSLWHELLLRYLQPQTLEQTLLSVLQPHLEPAFALN